MQHCVFYTHDKYSLLSAPFLEANVHTPHKQYSFMFVCVFRCVCMCNDCSTPRRTHKHSARKIALRVSLELHVTIHPNDVHAVYNMWVNVWVLCVLRATRLCSKLIGICGPIECVGLSVFVRASVTNILHVITNTRVRDWYEKQQQQQHNAAFLPLYERWKNWTRARALLSLLLLLQGFCHVRTFIFICMRHMFTRPKRALLWCHCSIVQYI